MRLEMIKKRSSREKQGKFLEKTKLMILLNTIFVGVGFGVCLVLHILIRKSFGEGTAKSLLPALAIGIAGLLAVGLGSSLWLGYELQKSTPLFLESSQRDMGVHG